jgi:hypothetical protein
VGIEASRVRVASMVVAMAVAASAQAAQRPGAAAERAKVIAALERLMLTGEPRHVDHDAGEWLQTAVTAAIKGGDSDIHRLALRAAVPLLPRISPPVSSIQNLPSISVEMPEVLKIPGRAHVKAEIYASVDGGDLFVLEGFPQSGGSIAPIFPEYARRPGLHHVRLQARITYKSDGALDLSDETRNLTELVYALYDAAVDAQYDARIFVMSPAWIKASSLDPDLPQAPFEGWLATTLARHGSRSDPRDWLSTFCDERILEAGLQPRSHDLCTVAYFEAKGVFGRIWFRTGRIEFGGSEVRWLAEAPTVQAVQLRSSDWVETDRLSALPSLLERPAETWPRGDVSVAPEDVLVTPGRQAVRISATIRNTGTADARGVYVRVVTGVMPNDTTPRGFVVDIPARGEARVRFTQPLLSAYAVVLVHAMQISEHTAYDSWTPDPTPDDAIAFRIVNPQKAPKDFVKWVSEQCAPICRGY